MSKTKPETSHAPDQSVVQSSHNVAITGGKWERYGYIGHQGLTQVRCSVGKDRVNRDIFKDIPLTATDAKAVVAIPDMLNLIAATYRALARGQWEEGETDEELSSRIMDTMTNHFGIHWLEQID